MAMNLIGPYPYSLYNTYVGSMAQEHRLDVISNNLANAGTPGFKRDVPVFTGYMLKGTKTDYRQGQLQQTGNTLDLALTGPGFFQVETPEGVRYTRNGSFTQNGAGQIVNMDGHPLVGAGVVPAGTVDLAVTADGRVLADGAQIGAINLVEFEDGALLGKEGNNYFTPKTDQVTPGAAQETTVEQGYLEMSNVNNVEAAINLIDTVRTYEVFQKVLHSFQEADNKSINEVGRLV